ncbi:RagB/SusD family nutrient uptake outer membrane protein [Galbibacter pacificus]|uniref:RagB/SusD family nutrient uptake outer membrane protein n=1 Tax=Galbibacter pacificus TaxID=2996052 RepID=A0ABT6FV30_9FLAO|nr:RagB/SusD family nutrient uptake outer membrane protein [Galbibacter pacificus]MDG3583567.1 RagB/SusD family nutrient uptake outer membrane protein [Galbibacter pacificus]MDG3586957.1 RagB/SusD family nutrient uptake outer membrane protein [Galbibacter pacificus]
MKKILYTILVAASITACDLDKFPYDSVASDELFESEGGLVAATGGSYSLLKGDADGNGFSPQLHRITEYPGDNVSLSGTTTDPLFYSYNYNNITTSGRVNNIWSAGYKAIVGCNKVIELAVEGETPEADQLIGENYYLRAYTYFQLVNVFGRPYNQGTSNLGVPLKLSSDINDVPDRNTVGEVYEQVVADLLKAESLMSINKTNAYATKEAAQALLSRVYLYMGQNDKAIAYADKVIGSGRFSLVPNAELGKYFQKTPEDNTETIFCFRYVEESDYNNGWYTVGSLYANIQGSGWGEMYASSSYLNLINEHPEDARKEFIEPQFEEDEEGNMIPAVYWINDNYVYQFRRTFEEGGKTYFTQDDVDYEVMSEAQDGDTAYYFTNTSNEKIYVTKGYDMYKRNGFPKFYILKTSLQEGVPHLWSPVVSRLAEMYLNKAEAYAKMNNESATLENVNIIRERAGIPAYGSASDFPEGKDLLDVVLDERRLELAYEGHRKFDVFRNNKVMDRRYPGTHLTGSNPYYEIQPTDNRVIEYIPENQINAQPTLIQND